MADDSSPDISTSAEPPHDVLAAEEFAMPAPDPDLHHIEPVVLPDDPTGIVEPHDVLAAEEFPIPAVAHKPPERKDKPPGRKDKPPGRKDKPPGRKHKPRGRKGQ